MVNHRSFFKHLTHVLALGIFCGVLSSGARAATRGPVTTIKVPARNATVTSLPTLSATATDVAGGVARVDFYLYRNADQMWWSGTAWGTVSTALPSSYSGGTVIVQGELPSPTSIDPATKLTDGIYTVYARAYDNAGNMTTVYSLFQVQTPIKVSCTITAPKKNSTINGLTSLQAKTTDSMGGTGVKSVDFYLMRNSDQMWWNGIAINWGDGPAYALPATQSVSGTWTKMGGLPMPSATDLTQKLTDGVYTLYARTTDIHGKVTTFSALFQQQTPVKVSCAVTIPARNSTVQALSQLQAKTVDSLGGTGVAGLDLYLKRNADNMFWSGSAWGTVATALHGTQSPSGTWTEFGNLPVPGTTDLTQKLTDGIYTVYARPTDIHGVVSTFSSLFQVQSPITVTVTISNPKKNATIASLTDLEVMTTDSMNGLGVASVSCGLRRAGDGLWWDGTSWVFDTALLPCKSGDSMGAWMTDAMMPSTSTGNARTMLTDGSYTVYAQAIDKNGKTTTVSVPFLVKSGQGVLQLSQLMASPMNGDSGPANGLSFQSAFSNTLTGESVIGTFVYRDTQKNVATDASHLIAFNSGTGLQFSDSSNSVGANHALQITESPLGPPVVTDTVSEGQPVTPAINQFIGTVVGSFTYTAPMVGDQYFYKAVQLLESASGKIESLFTSVSPASGGATPLLKPVITGSSGNLNALTLTATVTNSSAGGGAPTGTVQFVVQLIPDGNTSARFEQMFDLPGTLAPGDTTHSGVTAVGPDGSVTCQLIGLLLPAVQQAKTLVARVGLRNPSDMPGFMSDSLTKENFNFSDNFIVELGKSNSLVDGRSVSPKVASTQTLSTASADAANDTIKLTFTGGLDVIFASDPSRYTVVVGGTPVSALSASVNPAGTQVTLTTAEGVLKSGSRVDVGYNLLDGSGRQLSGQSSMSAK